MFKKVLVAEDIDSINHAVSTILREMDVEQVEHVQYCDKAWIVAKKAIQEGHPFDLLICDLSFKKDFRTEKIKGGKELIRVLKQEDPELKILVNSIEDHPQTIRTLWESGKVDGYVCKDRHGMRDLKEAVLHLSQGKNYLSPQIANSLQNDNLVLLKDFEIHLLNGIAKGMTQDEIQEDFRQKNITPNSKSSIEKRLKELREEFNAKTTAHLIGILKDLNLI